MDNGIFNRFQGCLIGGAIGDAVGSYYESQPPAIVNFDNIYGLTDDTQLTLATCEAIIENRGLKPEHVAAHLLKWYNTGRLRGLGASTLKALRDLQMGAHWALSGRGGEYAAGNGAAMRIAPLAFVLDVPAQRQLIRDICYITHKNEEAYVGALCILYALYFIIHDTKKEVLIPDIITVIPDTQVRDNLILLLEKDPKTIKEAAELTGTSGFVASSVPLSIFAAQQCNRIGFQNVLSELIQCGGDTDSNASMAGQLMGAATGFKSLPQEMLKVFVRLPEQEYISEIASKMEKQLIVLKK